MNFLGLCVGFIGCLFISLYIAEEYQYDRGFENTDRLYRVVTTYEDLAGGTATVEGPVALAPALLEEYDEVKAATTMLKTDKGFLFAGDKVFQENIIFTDQRFATVFGLKMITGTSETCLINANSIILSESLAIRMFGPDWKQQNISGQLLSLDGKFNYTITGVFKDLSDKSHFHSNLFASDTPDLLSGDRKGRTYILLKKDVSVNGFNTKISRAFSDRDWFKKSQCKSFQLQPVRDIHLYSELEEETGASGTIRDVASFGIAGGILLIICSINFMNLYAAGVATRMKEASIRRVIGGSQYEIFLQFLFEPIIITSLAMTTSLIAVYSLLPVANRTLDKVIPFSPLLSPYGVVTMVLITLLIGAVIGIYPALLAAHKSENSLMKSRSAAANNSWFQNSLVVIQFTLSSTMIALTIIAYQQTRMINTKDLGYDRGNVLILQNINMIGQLQEILSFKNELLSVPGVEHASISGYTPSQNLWTMIRPTFPGKNPMPQASSATWLTVDDGFLPTLAITLREGRNFSNNREKEQSTVLINQSAVKAFHLDAGGGPINQELSFRVDGTNEVRSYTIVGVVNDFNFSSLHNPVSPMVMAFGYHRYELALRLTPEHTKRTIDQISAIWKNHQPKVPIYYTFLADRYNHAHKVDTAASKLFTAIALLNIVVACIGLFGLVTYTTAQRTKEIGIRKVLGASGWLIVKMVSSSFVKLVGLAFIISLPLAFVAVNKWLERFAYKVDLSVWTFMTTGVIIFLVTLTTVCYITIRASRANPIDALKYE